MAENSSTQRLAWLDALRGIAAFGVVFDHLGSALLVNFRGLVYHWWDTGTYGVFVFFLISGYIVPASLERKGSVRTFWISRAFRLYPLYLLAIGFSFMLWFWGQISLRGAMKDPVNSLLAQLLMMSNVLRGPNVPNVVWSLTYEMVFYLLISALFTAGLHRFSGRYALGWAVLALALGGALPMVLISDHVTPWIVSGISDLLIAGGIIGAIMLRGPLRLAAGAVSAAVAVVLMMVNGGWAYPWVVLTIMALMFTGTMLYRAEQGQFPWRRAIPIAVVVFALCLVAGAWHSHVWSNGHPAEPFYERRWCISLTLAVLTFGAGMALRRSAVPRILAWLGLISYSVYLLHPALVDLMKHAILNGHNYPIPVQVVIALLFVVVLVAVCSGTYLLVERPAQRLGRNVAHWLDARYGPDRVRPELVGHAGVRARPVDAAARS